MPTRNRLKYTAVNMLVTTPRPSVTAKPLTGPEPNWNSAKAAISAVRFASMVRMASPKPALIAESGVRPSFRSSRTRS